MQHTITLLIHNIGNFWVKQDYEDEESHKIRQMLKFQDGIKEDSLC